MITIGSPSNGHSPQGKQCCDMHLLFQSSGSLPLRERTTSYYRQYGMAPELKGDAVYNSFNGIQNKSCIDVALLVHKETCVDRVVVVLMNKSNTDSFR